MRKLINAIVCHPATEDVALFILGLAMLTIIFIAASQPTYISQ